jgi:quercetin dioxygenase-like cupin family protein
MIAGMQVWQLDDEQVDVHRPRVLRSDDDANRVILLALPSGETLTDHQVHEHALIVLLDGALVARGGGEERAVSAPALVHTDPGERHEVQATSDCRLLICLAPWPGDGHPRRHSEQLAQH